MKPHIINSIIISVIILVLPLKPIRAEVYFLLGYRYIDTNYEFQHDTHQDDNFLPDSNKAGSAGTTALTNSLTNFFWSVGGRYSKDILNLSANLDILILFGGGEDRKQNINDSRPPSGGSYIYSTYYPPGLSGAFGLTYNVEKLYLGADIQATILPIESGWYRYGSDERQNSETEFILSIGPKIGYFLNENLTVESTFQMGQATSFSITFTGHF